MRKSLSNKEYIDGKQRIVLIHSDQDKLVLNNAYDQRLNQQVKLSKKRYR